MILKDRPKTFDKIDRAVEEGVAWRSYICRYIYIYIYISTKGSAVVENVGKC